MTKTFSPSHFSRAVGIRVIRFKRKYIGNMLPISVSYHAYGLLNVCSEPFVRALNVRAA